MLEYEIHSVEEYQLPDCLKTLHAAFGESAKIYGYTRESYPSSGAFITLDDLVKAKEKGVHIVSIAIDAPQDAIAALAGKVGNLSGVSVKTAYSNVISDD